MKHNIQGMYTYNIKYTGCVYIQYEIQYTGCVNI